jgi:hypothetical protein
MIGFREKTRNISSSPHSNNPIIYYSCRTRYRGGPKNNLSINRKRTDIWHLVLLGEKVLFEESPPSIMVTRNLNWSTEIL